MAGSSVVIDLISTAQLLKFFPRRSEVE
jgi:hypothetical protein